VHDYQKAGALLTALNSHPALQKEIKNFFTGKIPHGFKPADINGKITIGKKDLFLVTTAEEQDSAAAIKKAARLVTAEKSEQKRNENKQKINDYDAILSELATLKASKNEVSRAQLDKTNRQNTALKEHAIDSKNAETNAVLAAQRNQTANDLLTSENKKFLSELDNLKLELVALKSAYTKLTIENQTLTGQLLELRQGKPVKTSKPLRQGRIATKHA